MTAFLPRLDILPSAQLRAARRIIWFDPPELSLSNPVRLLTYAMKLSTDADMALLLDHVGFDGVRRALDNAPPGIIDARSWAYWNAKVGRCPAPPMPVRSVDR